MDQPKNYAILTNNTSQTQELVARLLGNIAINELDHLKNKRGLLFSRSEIERFMDEEERHDIKILTKDRNQPLKTMSSGEQKKALLNYLLNQEPDFLILVNPFDNLDVATQASLKEQLSEISKSRTLVQFASRLDDILPVITDFFKLNGNELEKYASPKEFWEANSHDAIQFKGTIPPPINPIKEENDELVNFTNVSVSFDGRQVLNSINWSVKQGEFWQLIGPNGSGKTTMLSMITGDSHKGYGQNLTLFGQKKGSGESVWDLKQKIGYFTPSVTDKFRGYHSLENMIISGLHDSIGLYVLPTEIEKRLAGEWLKLLGLYDKRDTHFRELTRGEKRLVMTARAMVKHPPLLILDEPTAGLDDKSAALFVALVNKIAKESDSAILFVSHRKETGHDPHHIFELHPSKNGSTGVIITSST
ncbi:ATP-binding cassette domain-containing protein [Muricauda sp. CAU 1633]|uniref:ATP-binding cassette domain-containing protein n=1 Tax=Allomuricauda sp. CAU 1633 TaxID=2816036 RepID=UPI001A8DAFAF|nr:ATP-binding cassette domain-containing protein [Muricauda sp. CAU 1633]MBO0321868.1 ATP-binding cassette domain-containing protein [Muricauda sp. CAU 1633]